MFTMVCAAHCTHVGSLTYLQYSQGGAHCDVTRAELSALNEVLLGQHLQLRAATKAAHNLGSNTLSLSALTMRVSGQAALPFNVTKVLTPAKAGALEGEF
jgi:hypothetical protein